MAAPTRDAVRKQVEPYARQLLTEAIEAKEQAEKFAEEMREKRDEYRSLRDGGLTTEELDLIEAEHFPPRVRRTKEEIEAEGNGEPAQGEPEPATA